MRLLPPLETLAACISFAVVLATATRAATELPAITVTGKITPSGDAVNRDQLWPQWYPDVGKVKIKDGSQILQKNAKFTWSGFDLPLDNRFGFFPSPLESTVVECVPESRISWVSYAGPTTEGPLCDMYHTWLLTPAGAKRCRVILEEVATGLAALHARGVNPEILHVSHQGWLERLKKTSESQSSKGLALVSQ